MIEVFVIFFLIIVVLFLFFKKGLDHNLEGFQQQLNRMNDVLDNRISESTKMMQSQSNEVHKIIRDVTEKLVNLDKTNQQVVGFSEQLNDLRKVLTNQKKRGSLGEVGLEIILENILPPTSFSLQYQFEDGDIVDAVIFAKEGMIPVDAKYSLDNYQRILEEENENEKKRLEKEFKNDLKKRIDETSKYIKPEEGTLEFAFMFIPAEPIYYDLLVNEVGSIKSRKRNLIDYAFNDKKVIIVSPTTFAAYLLTVLQGLKAFKIEESTKSIRKNVESLSTHMKSYEEFMKKLGVSLGSSMSHYENAYKEFNKMDKDIMRVTKEDSLKNN